MTAPGISREGQVGDAGRFPKADRVTPFGFVADADRNPRIDADTGRIAAFRPGTGAQFGKCGGRLVTGGVGERHPSVAPFDDAAQGHVGMPAIPDRDGALRRQRVDPGILDRVKFALEGHMTLGPQRLHDLDLLFRAASTVVEILVEADELDRVPADADAEAKAAAAQHVERSGLFRHENGLALRQDQHLRRKLDVPRAAGKEAEQHERVVKEIRRGVAVAPIGPARDIDPQHMIRRGQILIADLLGRLGKITDRHRIAADLGIDQGQRHTKLHRKSPLPSSARL